MNFRNLTTTLVLMSASLATPVKASEILTQTPTPSNQQIINACVNNKAETLPIPFKDVSPNHWAFKAVMTMHYCGAFRQATPPELWQKTLPTEMTTPQEKLQSDLRSEV